MSNPQVAIAKDKKQQQEAATVPQVAKVIQQLSCADKMTMQRLAGGMAKSIAEADLTRITGFDLCRFLKVKLPFFVPGMRAQLEHAVPVDNQTPLLELLARVGGDNFRQLDEKEKGPDEASFFLLQPEKNSSTLERVRRLVHSYDLKLATAREMASLSLHMKGKVPFCPYGEPFLLCGMDEFSPPRWRHLLFFPCSVSTKTLNTLEHLSAHDEDFDGERRDAWQSSPRVYLVRRMTQEEICNRQDLP